MKVIKEIAKMVKTIERMLESAEYISKVRKKESNFTRNRKLVFKELVVFILTLPKKTLTIELNNYFVDNKKKSDQVIVSKQAFSVARQKVDEVVFKDIIDITVNTRYESEYVNLYKGYRILAEDGSTEKLPEKKELIDYFGVQSNQIKDVPMARISIIVDVLNDIIIDCDICKYSVKKDKDIKKKTKKEKMGIDERSLAIKHLDKVANNKKYKNIILYDRGYPSREMIKELEDKKQFFVMRTSKGFLKDIVLGPMGESVVYFEYNQKRFKLRVLKFLLDGGTEETLITNIFSEEFTIGEFKEIYFMRWGVETKYNEIKNQLKLQNFSGVKVISIKQDFLATVVMCNISAYFKACIDNEINISNVNKNNKYKQKSNKNVLFGTIKSKIQLLILNKRALHKTIENIVSICKKSRSPIRPNRKNERNHKSIKPRFYTNKKSAI